MMRKKSALLLAMALFFCFVFSACSKPGDDFTLLVEAIPSNLDPQLAATGAEKTAIINLFEGLYRRDTGGRPTLAAAQSAEVSADGLEWRFTLREGAAWQDGTPLTADDFVFTFERIADARTGSPWRGTFSNILSAKAENEHTLMLRLTTPDASLPQKLCEAGASPTNRAFFESTSGAYGLSASALLCNGPLRFSYWVPGSTLILKRVTEEKGWVGALRFSAPEKGDSRSLTQRYLDGEGSGALLANATTENGVALHSFQLTTWVLVFNTQHEFLREEPIRTALGSAALGALTALPENSGAAFGLIPPGVNSTGGGWREHYGTAITPEADPQALLRTTLQAASLTIPTLTVLVPEELLSHMQAINTEWQKQLGCYFNLEALPQSEVENRVATGAYDIALTPAYASAGDAATLLASFTGGSAAAGHWQSESFDALVATAQSTAGSEAGDAAAWQAEQLLCASWPIAPLWHETSTFTTREAFAHIAIDPFGPVVDVSAPG